LMWAKGGAGGVSPLRRRGGGGGTTPPYREKNANRDVCVFFYRSAPGHGPGAAPPPLSRRRTGLRPEGVARSGMTGESKPLLFVFPAGEARRRGGGTMEAASMTSPEFAGLVGWAAMGGHSTRGSPRGCIVRVRVVGEMLTIYKKLGTC
jgi:hypothetical protein